MSLPGPGGRHPAVAVPALPPAPAHATMRLMATPRANASVLTSARMAAGMTSRARRTAQTQAG